jgi:hypothetical protein
MTELNNPCNIVRRLTEDRPGEHWYVFTCSQCHREISDEWVERVWGRSEPPARINPHLCQPIPTLPSGYTRTSAPSTGPATDSTRSRIEVMSGVHGCACCTPLLNS